MIESERSGHRLLVNGQKIATFATLAAAEAEANKVAGRAVPGVTLRFELDFKWTLTDLEIRAATLAMENAEAARLMSESSNRPAPAPIGSGRE